MLFGAAITSLDVVKNSQTPQNAKKIIALRAVPICNYDILAFLT